MKNKRLIAAWTYFACFSPLIASSVMAQEERASAADADRSRREIDQRPATAWEYYGRARSWSAQGRSELALADFDRAIALNPKFGAAYNGRGNEHFRSGDYERAIADYNEAVFLDPNPGIAYCNRAGAWLKSGEVEIALDDYSEAIERNPTYAPAYFGRANAWVAEAKYSRALADYRQAIQFDPQYAAAYDNLAWILASAPLSEHRNGEQAIEMATKACELTDWKQADFIATLAAAHAETGNFADAIHWQKRAIELAPERKPLQSRLVTYLARRPYHAQPSKEL